MAAAQRRINEQIGCLSYGLDPRRAPGVRPDESVDIQPFLSLELSTNQLCYVAEDTIDPQNPTAGGHLRLPDQNRSVFARHVASFAPTEGLAGVVRNHPVVIDSEFSVSGRLSRSG